MLLLALLASLEAVTALDLSAMAPTSDSNLPVKRYIFQHIGKAAGTEIKKRLVCDGVWPMFRRCHPGACLQAKNAADYDGMITSVSMLLRPVPRPVAVALPSATWG
jgi:hypothetical protein